jgi:hypothetical protein
MTNKEINELFATKIWKWHKDTVTWLADIWATDDCQVSYYCRDYTPSTNFLQAFEALKKFCKDKGFCWSLTYIIDDERYCCRIYSIFGLATDRTIAYVDNCFDEIAAICGALVKALEAKP